MKLMKTGTARRARGTAGPDGPGDAKLVDRVLRGHRDSFGTLVRRHQAALYRQARGMGLDPDTAEDMVQEALVRAYTGLQACRETHRFRAWVFRILRNVCLDHLKNVRRRDVSLESPDGDTGGRERFGAPDHADLRHELDDALGRLSPLLREAFLLRHQAGYSYDELADITDSSASAVKMRVHRAREELRELLGAEREDVTTTGTRSSIH